MRPGHRRVAFGVVDQVLSSVSNVLVIFAVARVTSIGDFGAISLAVTAMTTAVAAGRGLLGTPINLLSDDQERLHREASFALAVALLFGVVAGMMISFSAILAPNPQAVLVVACSVPIVMVQDVGRYYCIAAGRPERAALSDGGWALGSAAIFGATIWSPGSLGAVQLLFGWACLAVLAGCAILLSSRLAPTIVGISDWWRRTFHDRARFAFEAAIGASSSLLVLGASTAILGVTAAAALRGAGTVLGPLSILMSAIPLALVPELRRQRKVSVVETWKPLSMVAFGLSLLSVSVGIVAFLIPQTWGEFFLGESWRVVRPLMPVTATEYAALAWLTAVGGALMIQSRSGDLLKIRIILSGVTLGGAVLGAAIFGSYIAVAVALAIASATVALLSCYILINKRGRRKSTALTRS